jgi:Xaa-Pro aminopeptidase
VSLEDRLNRLRRSIEERELDGILISRPENRRYLSGFTGSDGYLLITGRDVILATDSRYTIQAGLQAPGFRLIQIAGDPSRWFPDLLAATGAGRLGFEAGHASFAFYRQLCDVLGHEMAATRLVPTRDIVETLRAVKEPAEIEAMTRAAGISDAAVAYISGRIQPGMTEKQLAWDIERFMREQGSEAVPFPIIVAAGPNAALPHHEPSARPVQTGEPVLFDIGASVDGYGSDLSRTICLGPPDATFKKVYDIVLGAQLAALHIIKDGMTGAEADGLARAVIEEAGYGDSFGHGLGHGVGLVTHELPRLGARSGDRLENGMAFTLEPGIYIEGWGGVRTEDLVIMESGRAREISKAPK